MYDAYLFNIFSYQYLFELQKNVQSNIWIVVYILNIFHSLLKVLQLAFLDIRK